MASDLDIFHQLCSKLIKDIGVSENIINHFDNNKYKYSSLLHVLINDLDKPFYSKVFEIFDQFKQYFDDKFFETMMLLKGYVCVDRTLLENFSILDNIELTDYQKIDFLKFFNGLGSFEVKDIENINKKIKVWTNEYIKIIIKTYPLEVFEYLVKIEKIISCIDYLLYACRYRRSKIIQFLVLNKVIPTHECLENLLLNTKSDYYYFNAVTQNSLSILLEIGIPLTKNDVINIVNRGLDIINFGYVDLIDDDVFNECVENGHYLTILSKFKPSMSSVHNLLRTSIEKVPERVLCNINRCDLGCLVISNKASRENLMFVLRRDIDVDYKIIKNIVDEKYSDDEEIQELLKLHIKKGRI
jgi:hypothetical protein